MFRLNQVEELQLVHSNEFNNLMKYALHFSKDDRRFHVWITSEGKINSDEVLHSNIRDMTTKKHDHKALNLNTQRWDKLRSDILAYVTPERMAEADAVKAAKDAARRNAEAEQEAEKYRTAIRRILTDRELVNLLSRDTAFGLSDLSEHSNNAVLVTICRMIRNA